MNKKSSAIIYVVAAFIVLTGAIIYFITVNNARQITTVPETARQPAPAPQQRQTEQPIAGQEDQSGAPSVEPVIDKTTGWQTFNYADKGVSISVPRGWEENKYTQTFSDGKNQMTVSFPGNEPARGTSTGKEEVENMIATAFRKTNTKESLREDSFVREDLTLGRNTVYKLYHPGYSGSSYYYIKRKNNTGFVEFFYDEGSDGSIIESIVGKVEIH